MTMLTPERFIKSIHRSALVLDSLLSKVSSETAQAATDGADGWNILEILCHLYDFDRIFQERAQLMLTEDNPTLPAYDHEALAIERHYRAQDFNDVLARFREQRATLITWFTDRPADAWTRGGMHPEAGPITLFEQVVQIATHDLDHLEQIVRVLDQYQAG